MNNTGFMPTDFYYFSYVDYDYDRERECSYDNNICDGICRCSRITRCQISSVDTWKFAEQISLIENASILTYCIDRLLVINQIHYTDYWDFNITRGYYGDEFEGLKFLKADDVNEQLSKLYSIADDSARIKFVLVAEYGYLLESIKDLVFGLEVIKRDEIKIPNLQYSQEVNPEHYQSEQWRAGIKHKHLSYQGPIAVLRENSAGQLILIDGYHRYAASEGETNVKVIVGRPGKS